jgi:hypothetical protein
MFWVELQGFGQDGKPAAAKIGKPLQTIQAAKAEAYRLYNAEAYGPLVTVSAYHILDEAAKIVGKGQF